MESIDLFSRALAQPVHAFRRMIDLRPMLTAVAVVMFATFSAELGKLLVWQAGGGGSPLPLLAAGWLVSLLAALVGLFLLAGAMHIVADMSGGAGSGFALFLCLCLALAPNLLCAPLALAVRPFGATGAGIYVAGSAVRLGWTLALMALAVREVYRFSTGRAVGLLVLSGGIGVMCLVLFVGAAAVAVAMQLAGAAADLTGGLSLVDG